MKKETQDRILVAVERFLSWFEDYGEKSFDHQSFYAGRFGGRAKALYYRRPEIGLFAVAPMVFCEAFLPSVRRFFWERQRFPIADAHFAMGFALLAEMTRRNGYYDRAVHFLGELEKSRSEGFEHYCWGYPFDWVTGTGTIPANTPFITTLPYAYEAFKYVQHLDKNERWLEIMRSMAEHASRDIKDFEMSPGVCSCGYSPYDNKGGVINASAYRAFLLTSATIDLSDDRYWKVAERNLNFVLEQQQPDGSWYYAMDSRDFIDHFHTCFVLKALAKIESLTGHAKCRRAMEKGIEYYLNHLFDLDSLPKPFAKAPRLTVYRNELYDYAECINLCVLLKDSYPELEKLLENVLNDLLRRWQKPDGSFRSRKLFIGWDNIPMHRWAQSQLFRSLCFLLYQEKQDSRPFNSTS